MLYIAAIFRIVQCVGRHSMAKQRRHPSVFVASVVGPAAVFLAAAADGSRHVPVEPAPVEAVETVAEAAPVVVEETAAPCCIEVVASPPAAFQQMLTVDQASMDSAAPVALVAASRYRVVNPTLPAGVAPERGLQVRTILTARSVSAVFPEINQIGGVRQDALRWHPNGLALDVMIPNPGSESGIALGNQIVAYVLKHAQRFGIQDAIWRGVYYTPNGARPGGYGHYDHVHITTTGGGYPDGDEVYFR
jgi:hypothetical protein